MSICNWAITQKRLSSRKRSQNTSTWESVKKKRSEVKRHHWKMSFFRQLCLFLQPVWENLPFPRGPQWPLISLQQTCKNLLNNHLWSQNMIRFSLRIFFPNFFSSLYIHFDIHHSSSLFPFPHWQYHVWFDLIWFGVLGLIIVY